MRDAGLHARDGDLAALVDDDVDLALHLLLTLVVGGGLAAEGLGRGFYQALHLRFSRQELRQPRSIFRIAVAVSQQQVEHLAPL